MGQGKRCLRRADAAANNYDLLPGLECAAFKTWFEDMLNARTVGAQGRGPCRPMRLFRRADRKRHVGGVKSAGGGFDAPQLAMSFKAAGAIDDMPFFQVAFGHQRLILRGEERQRRPAECAFGCWMLPALTGLGKRKQCFGVQVKMMDARRAQGGHTGVGGAAIPTLQ